MSCRSKALRAVIRYNEIEQQLFAFACLSHRNGKSYAVAGCHIAQSNSLFQSFVSFDKRCCRKVKTLKRAECVTVCYCDFSVAVFYGIESEFDKLVGSAHLHKFGAFLAGGGNDAV